MQKATLWDTKGGRQKIYAVSISSNYINNMVSLTPPLFFFPLPSLVLVQIVAVRQMETGEILELKTVCSYDYMGVSNII